LNTGAEAGKTRRRFGGEPPDASHNEVVILSIDTVNTPLPEAAFSPVEAEIHSPAHRARSVADLTRLLHQREAELRALYTAGQQEVPGGWSF
jgi:hypothetical protein